MFGALSGLEGVVGPLQRFEHGGELGFINLFVSKNRTKGGELVEGAERNHHTERAVSQHTFRWYARCGEDVKCNDYTRRVE